MNDASPAASGASNASDFQPPTQNPQSTGTNLQPTDTDGSAGNLDKLPAKQLTVETVQSSPDSTITLVPSGGNNMFVNFLPFFVMLTVAYLLFRRWNFFRPAPSETVVESVAAAPAAKKETKKAAKKPTNTRPKKKSQIRRKK